MLLSMNGHGGDTLTRDAGPPVAFLTVLLTGSRATIFPITEHNIRSLYEMNDSCHFGYIASRALQTADPQINGAMHDHEMHNSWASTAAGDYMSLKNELRSTRTCVPRNLIHK